MLTAERRQALAVCLLIAIGLIGTYFVILDKSQFFRYDSVSLDFELRNQTDETLDASFFLYIGSYGSLNSSGIEPSKLHGNFSVSDISDGSGIEVDCLGLAPSDYLSFVIQEIEVTPSLRGIGDARIELSFRVGNLSDFGYTAVVSLHNNQGVSIASLSYQTVGTYAIVQERTTPLYLNVLIVVVTAFFIGTAAMIVWQRAKWFPIVTVSILLITLLLYVVIGSAYEIHARNWWWLSILLSVFIHGYDWHIFGNLFFFTILSVLFESFLRMKAQWMKKGMLYWYFVPLLFPTVLVFTPWFGFGLSFSIEIMTWALWAYITMNYRELIASKIRTFLAVLAGIPSYTFLGWVVGYLFGSENDTYDNSLALNHIGFGIVSGVLVLGVLVVVFRHGIRQKLKKAISYRSKETGAAFNGA